LTFIEAGTELVVTPHITNDRRIILDLEPKRSDAEIDPITRAPIITTSEAKTTVIVDNGQTVVIGGLTSKKESTIERGFPILKDIPILGYFFKYKKVEVIKQDLIIFITPNIIDNSKHSFKPTVSNIDTNFEPEESNVNLDNDYNIVTPEPETEVNDEVDDEDVGDFLDEIGQ